MGKTKGNVKPSHQNYPHNKLVNMMSLEASLHMASLFFLNKRAQNKLT